MSIDLHFWFKTAFFQIKMLLFCTVGYSLFFASELHYDERSFLYMINGKYVAFNCNYKLQEQSNYLLAVRLKAYKCDVEFEKIKGREIPEMCNYTYCQKFFSMAEDHSRVNDNLSIEKYFNTIYTPYLEHNKKIYYRYLYYDFYFFYNKNLFLGKIKQTPYEINTQLLMRVTDNGVIDDINKGKHFVKKNYYNIKFQNGFNDKLNGIFNTLFNNIKQVPKEIEKILFYYIFQKNAYFLITVWPRVYKKGYTLWYNNKEIQQTVKDIVSFNRTLSNSVLMGQAVPFHFFTDTRFCQNFKVQNKYDWHQFFLCSEILYFGSKDDMSILYIDPETRGWVPKYKNTLENHALLKMLENYCDDSPDFYQTTLLQLYVKKKCGQKHIALEHTIIHHILKNNIYFFATKRALSLVCKNWYRYFKESCTILKLERSISHHTNEFAQMIRSAFLMNRADYCYLELKERLINSMPRAQYDLNKLWKEIQYKEKKECLFKSNICPSEYMNYIFGCTFFVEIATLIKPIFPKKNIDDDILDVTTHLKKILYKALTDGSCKEKIKQQLDQISLNVERHKSFLLLIEESKSIIGLLKETSLDGIEKDADNQITVLSTSTMSSTNSSTKKSTVKSNILHFGSIVTKANFLIKYFINLINRFIRYIFLIW